MVIDFVIGHEIRKDCIAVLVQVGDPVTDALVTRHGKARRYGRVIDP